MLDRKSLVFTLPGLTTLALLAALVSWPHRMSASFPEASRVDGLLHNVAPSPGSLAMELRPAEIPNKGLDEDPFSPEDEEQVRAESLENPRVSFHHPWTYGKPADLQPIPPHSHLSLYPLRC